ncbi:MAG: xanthine dehydrogenase family protein molybdopterin-binding subunit [Pseudomonadota bacterium]
MNMQAPKSFGPTSSGVGASPKRKEDDALLRGKGHFTADDIPAGALRMVVARSAFASADFTIDNLDDVKAMDGVQLLLTAADLTQYGDLPCEALRKQKDGSEMNAADIPLLAKGRACHVGDALAIVVADTEQQATDAAEALDVTYSNTPVAAETDTALDPATAHVHPDLGTNLAGHTFVGDDAKTQAAFAKAARVTELTIVNNRLVSNFLEPRACIAEVDEERLTLTTGTQGVHSVRKIIAEKIMRLPLEELRVITRDVGGGFGTKAFVFREYPLALIAARELGRPVVWVGTRTEHFLTDAQGRDNLVTAKMAMDAEGNFLGLKIDLIANMGAYLSQYSPFIPWLGASMATGLYDIPALSMDMYLVYTNTCPVDAYRGAGRPEATYLIERLVDACAADLGVDRIELRKRNFIKPEQFPYETQAGRTYDVGKFEEHLNIALAEVDWDGIQSRRAEAATRGKFRGIGCATYIEACAFAGSEPAIARLNEDGTATIFIGTQTNGQGHATAYAQFAAEKLGLDIDAIDVRQGDTDELKSGGGTGGSRSIPLGGVSVSRASETLASQIKVEAAQLLDIDPSEIELSDGVARQTGGNAFVPFAEIAQAADGVLTATATFKQEEATYPNGTHVCELEIDPETGITEIIDYTIVDDFGVVVNPLLLAGQVHGGVVQGIGQCLTERTVYDGEGQLLSASFMDYTMPRADDVPFITFSTHNVPSITNAMGIKGAGEAGTIGACPSVMNAMVDALTHGCGVTHIDMPATPHLVWRAIQAAAEKAA